MVGINSALVLWHARSRNPISRYRAALGNGAGASSFLATTDRSNASGQRALTGRCQLAIGKALRMNQLGRVDGLVPMDSGEQLGARRGELHIDPGFMPP